MPAEFLFIKLNSIYFVALEDATGEPTDPLFLLDKKALLGV
jgi:hypothetical protein